MGRRSDIEELYHEHGTELVLFATSFTNDRSGAQDIVHEVFLNLLDREYSIVDEPRAYLYRAVRNTVLNTLKASARNTELPDEAWFVAPASSPENELSLRSALRELSQEQRELVLMQCGAALRLPRSRECLISALTLQRRGTAMRSPTCANA